MANQLSPGVTTVRLKTGSPTIAGVATGVGGFLGTATRGPINSPQMITSPEQFRQVFGGPFPGSHLFTAVDGFFQNGGRRCYVSRVAHYTTIADAGTLTAVRATATLANANDDAIFSFAALNHGAWGNQLTITSARENELATHTADAIPDGPVSTFRVRSAALLSIGDTITVTNGTFLFSAVITAISGDLITIITGVTLGTGGAGLAAGASVFNNTFTITVVDSQTNTTQRHTKLRASPLSARNYFLTRMNVEGSLVTASDLQGAGNGDRRPVDATNLAFTGGADGGTIVSADFTGSAASATGLYAFDKVDDIALLSAPGWNDATTQLAGAQYCTGRHDVYWIGAGPLGQSPSAMKTWKTTTANIASENAAIYYPNIRIQDPLSGALITFPPEGHLQGMFARTDANRSVGKAPAGSSDGVLFGAIGVEYEMSQGEYDSLYPSGINGILNIRNTGICVFGSRNSYLSGDYPQINQIRTVIYIEKSLKEGSRWVNFENNDVTTRARVARAFRAFLRSARRDGILQGATDDEAFYVICDETNNPESQVREGKLRARVGLAVNSPAEFVEIEIERDTRALNAELAG